MKLNRHLFFVSTLLLLLSSCSKRADNTPVTPPVDPPVDTVATSDILKEVTDIPLGVAIDYYPMINDPLYNATVKQVFDGVTFAYQMKHGAIVKDDGSMDFTNTDALVNASAGLQIFGHVLGWHQNQNAVYLKNYAGIIASSGTELLTNPGFENSMSELTGWSVFNAQNGAAVSLETNAANVHSNSLSMKVENPVANATEQWKVQVASDLFNTKTGTQYTVSYWVKAAAAAGSIRLSTGSTPQYQADQPIGTDWQQVSWTITAKDAQTRILFDMGAAANTYYIDDVSVREVVSNGSGEAVAAKLDTALHTFINAIVTRYKDKVKAWDVVNELFAENGALRSNANTTPTAGSNDMLVWSDPGYLGRSYAVKAFQYAKDADPTAKLFINDYNLEYFPAKLDSLIAMVNFLKTEGATVDGIGTQMHIDINIAKPAIDAMMKKLAATGLLIRISELDVRANPSAQAGFTLTPDLEAKQADIYKYVIHSYIANIPKAQQFGITIWGLTDNTSWLYNEGKDFPLLYRSDYSRKMAYTAVWEAFQGK